MNRNRIVAQCFVGDRDIAMEMICLGKPTTGPVRAVTIQLVNDRGTGAGRSAVTE
jgi:endonuclease YncB( thermonuclease family)